MHFTPRERGGGERERERERTREREREREKHTCAYGCVYTCIAALIALGMGELDGAFVVVGILLALVTEFVVRFW
jgi:hypothetical protein